MTEKLFVSECWHTPVTFSLQIYTLSVAFYYYDIKDVFYADISNTPYTTPGHRIYRLLDSSTNRSLFVENFGTPEWPVQDTVQNVISSINSVNVPSKLAQLLILATVAVKLTVEQAVGGLKSTRRRHFSLATFYTHDFETGLIIVITRSWRKVCT